MGHDNMVTKKLLVGKGTLIMIVLSVLGVVTALVTVMVLDGDGSGREGGDNSDGDCTGDVTALTKLTRWQ